MRLVKIFSQLLVVLLLSGAAHAAEPVKISKSSICHAPNNLLQINKEQHSLQTLDECLKAGERLLKR